MKAAMGTTRFILALVLSVSFAIAQARGPTSEPTTKPAPWTLRDGAPEGIKNWFWRQPELRQEKRSEFEPVIQREESNLRSINAELQARQLNIPAGRRSGRRGGNKTIPELEKDSKASREKIESLKKERDSYNNERFVMPPVPLIVDSFGNMPTVVRVIQVVGDKDAIIDYTGKTLWLHGVSMERVVDDQRFMVRFAVLISGTKSYLGTDRASHKVLLAEECNEMEWLTRSP
jgi:hypothetical protein